MTWYGGLEPILRRGQSLAERTTFRIGGAAEFFLDPPDEQAFSAACAAAARADLPVRILGAGSNVLISDDGVPGIVISTVGLRNGPPEVSGPVLRVLAGAMLAELVQWTARAGLRGLECLAGIPGTVGGAVRMNAGNGRGEISDRVTRFWCVDGYGKIFERRRGQVRWAHRATDIAEPIMAVELTLDRDRPAEIRRRLAEILAERRESQPVDVPTAGCFFKNPPGDFAGRLIERAGLKGERVGTACVSPKHANFIVNLGGATAADVLRLSMTVRERVRNRFGVLLENEVHCWPTAAA